MGLTTKEVKYGEDAWELMLSERLAYCLGLLQTVRKNVNCMEKYGINELWR